MSKSTVISRKDMKEPDKFQEAATQAASWLASRKRHVALAGAVALVLVLVVAAVSLVQGRREASAGAAGTELLTTVAAPIAQAAAPGGSPTFPNEDAKQRAIVAAADKLIAEHSGTGAAELALLAKGDAHYKLRELDPAKDAYEKFLGTASAKDSLRFGALEGLGLVAEAKGDLDGAAKAYDRMAKDAPQFADRADLERARVLEEAGKTADAKAILSEFAKKHEKSLLTPEAAQRLARLGGQ